MPFYSVKRSGSFFEVRAIRGSLGQGFPKKDPKFLSYDSGGWTMMVSCSRTEGLVSYVLPCAHDFFEHLPKDLPLMFPFPDSFVEPCPCNL